MEEDMQVTPVSEEAVIDFLHSIIDGRNTAASAPTFPTSDRLYLTQLGGGLAARISPPNHVPASTLQKAPRSRISMEEGEIYDPTLQDQYRRHLSSIVLMNLDRRQVRQDHEEAETRDENRRLAVEKAFTTADCEHFASLNKRVGTELVDRAERKKDNADENGDRKRSALSELQVTNLDERDDSISALPKTITTPSSIAGTNSISRSAESGPVGDIIAKKPSPQASTRNDLEASSAALLAPPIRIRHDELTCNEPLAYKDPGFRYPPQAPSHKRNQLRNRKYSSRSPSPRPLSVRSVDAPRRFSAYDMPKRQRYSIDYDSDDDDRRSPYRGVKRLRRDYDVPPYGEPSPPPARFRSPSSSPTSPRSLRPVHRLPERSYRDEAKELGEARKHTYRGRSRTPPRRSPHWNNPCSQRSSPYKSDRDDEPRPRRSLSPANDFTESRAPVPPRLTLITEGTPPEPSSTNPDEPSSAVSTTPTAVEINPYGSLPLPVPGLWVAERGLPNVAILPLEFTLNPEASKQLCVSSQFSPSATFPFRLQLICMRSDTATKILGAAATDWTSVSALVTDLLSTRMEWPQRGDLIVEINKGTPWHKAWMPQDLGPNDPPLDLTQFVREDLNCVRLIQLGDMSMFAFLLVASIAPERANPSANIAKILLSQSKCGLLTLPTGAGSS